MSLPFKKQQIESFQYNDEESKEEEGEDAEIQQEQQPQESRVDVDKETLIEAYKYLIEYKNNLFRVELLLLTEDDNETIKELNTIKEQLVPAIEAQEEQIKSMQLTNEFRYSTERLKTEDVDKLCKAFYEKDNKWYNARIIQIDADAQEAEVQFIGYQDNLTLHAIFIKLIKPPDASLFEVGTLCEAIYPGDGRYYQCSIEKISEEGYYVKFKKYHNRELISIYHLREPKKIIGDSQSQKKMFEDLEEFKVPENLKILPSDNEQQRQAKKKKLKAMKQAFKMAQYEKYSSEQQNKWQSFNQKVSTFKPDIGQKVEKLYKSMPSNKPDDSLNKSLLTQQAKLRIRDNSHLKRLF